MSSHGPAGSLRRRLTSVTLATALLVWAVSSLAVYTVSLRVIGTVFDTAMMEAASMLLGFADHEYVETGDAFAAVAHASGIDNQPYLHYQIWNGAHQMVLRSQQAPATPLSADFHEGLGDQRVMGERWRVYTLSSGRSSLQIQIGEPYEHRRQAGHKIILALMTAMLLFVSVLLAALWIMISRISSMMRRSALEVGTRSGNDLSPLPSSILPSEFKPLTSAINGLLARLGTALERERRLAVDAAHELRTPLAVIKTQLDVAQRTATPEETAQALQKLEAGVARATRMVEQLLTASRIDSMSGDAGPIERIDVRNEVRVLLEHEQDQISRKRLHVRCDIADSRWDANLVLARILLRNLLDNALRYSRDDGAVHIRYALLDDAQILEVSDNGPGIPETVRDRVFEPFYRVPGSASSGSGLGLAIVRHIVSIIGGEIELRPGLSGTGVTVHVRLPRSPTPPTTRQDD